MKLVPVLALVPLAALAGYAAGVQEEASFTPAKPTEQHELLDRMAGTWHAEVEMMGQKSEGTYTLERGLGGLWLLGHFEGEAFGQSFTGHDVMGYDPEQQKYVSIWVDSMSTSMVQSEGTWREDESMLVMETESENPMTGEAMQEEHRITLHGDDRMTFQMVGMMPDGTEFPMMRIEYTRKGDAKSGQGHSKEKKDKKEKPAKDAKQG